MKRAQGSKVRSEVTLQVGKSGSSGAETVPESLSSLSSDRSRQISRKRKRRETSPLAGMQLRWMPSSVKSIRT